MAVQKNKTNKLTLKVVTEVDAGGAKTYAQRNIANLNPDLTDDDARESGTRLASLQTHSLDSVRRTISYDIAAA